MGSSRYTEEEGFTLIELLVATTIAVALFGVAVTMFTSLLGSEPRSASRSEQLESGRVMLERVTREVRQGKWADPNGGYTLDLDTSVCESGAETCDVVYTCSGSACERTEDTTTVQMVDGLDLSQPVFTEDAVSSSFIEVSLTYPGGSGAEAVTLSDGVALRNYVEPGS